MTVRLANASHFELNDNGEHQLNENTVTVLEKQVSCITSGVNRVWGLGRDAVSRCSRERNMLPTGTGFSLNRTTVSCWHATLSFIFSRIICWKTVCQHRAPCSLRNKVAYFNYCFSCLVILLWKVILQKVLWHYKCPSHIVYLNSIIITLPFYIIFFYTSNSYFYHIYYVLVWLFSSIYKLYVGNTMLSVKLNLIGCPKAYPSGDTIILINFVATPSKNVLRQITALLVVILKWPTTTTTQRLTEPVWRISDGVQHPTHIYPSPVVPRVSTAVTVGARFLNSWHRSLATGYSTTLPAGRTGRSARAVVVASSQRACRAERTRHWTEAPEYGTASM